MTKATGGVQGIDRVAALLRRVKLDLGVEDLADALWLAAWIDEAEFIEETPEKQKQPSVTAEVGTSAPPTSTTAADEPKAQLKMPQSEPRSSPSASTEGVPIQAPAAPALRTRLDLSRAMRPLMRKVPSPARMMLDEEETVFRIAEQGVWSLVVRPAPERWLELALVIEDSQSTPLWQETIADFQTLAERQGSFRTVRGWRLSADSDGTPKLSTTRCAITPKHPSRSPKELLHPAGRRLIVVVSDCRSAMWHRAGIYRWLKFWGKHAPLTILQLLPERLWSQSALGLGVPVWLSALAPGVVSARLTATEHPQIWTPELDSDSDPLTLPVVTLEPEPIKQWVRVVTGSGEVQTAGIRLDLSLLAHPAPSGASRTETSLSPADRVQRFRTTASLTAQKLAGLMASAPVHSQIIHLLRQTLLPTARQVHVAEVFMSGLLRPRSSERERSLLGPIQYEFVDESIRDLLADAVPIPETEAVLDTVSQYIANRIGLNVKSFEALLFPHEELSFSAKQEILPFAQIAQRVLRRLGGEYALIAERLENPRPVAPKPPKPSPVDEFPPLKPFRFREAIISFLQPFEFETASIEIKQKKPTASQSIEEIITALDELLSNQEPPQRLKATRKAILRGAWEGQTYEEIGDHINRSAKSLKKQGAQLWELLSKALGENVTKSNLHNVLTRWASQIGESGLSLNLSQRQAWQFIEALGNGVELEMVSIPGGSFTMGSPEGEEGRTDDEGPQHPVTIPPFFISKYPITQAQWRAVAQLSQVKQELDSDPSEFKEEEESDRHPVESITWYDAVEFCDRLSAFTNRQYRLPSEAEWEYACRAGTDTPFCFGETLTTDLANYSYERERTTPVGSFPANAFGLYDMHGNVWEWCADHWHESYEKAPSDETIWSSSDEEAERVLRGGSWNNSPGFCRSAARAWNRPDGRYSLLGLRVVCAAART